MTTVFAGLGILHWIGFIAIVVGYVLGLQRQVIHPLMVWAARVQLLLGLAMVAAFEIGDLGMLNHTFIGIKLVIALAVVALCEIASSRAKRGANLPILMQGAFVLAAVNFLVAMTMS